MIMGQGTLIMGCYKNSYLLIFLLICNLNISCSAFADGQIKCPGCRQDADPHTEFVTLDLVRFKKSGTKM